MVIINKLKINNNLNKIIIPMSSLKPLLFITLIVFSVLSSQQNGKIKKLNYIIKVVKLLYFYFPYYFILFFFNFLKTLKLLYVEWEKMSKRK